MCLSASKRAFYWFKTICPVVYSPIEISVFDLINNKNKCFRAYKRPKNVRFIVSNLEYSSVENRRLRPYKHEKCAFQRLNMHLTA